MPLAVVCYLVAIRPLGHVENSFYAAAIDKEKLLRETPSPKIVFLGGSNIAFGMDCERVERELGRPTINMGVHAGLGVAYQLQEAAPGLRSGDVFILVPEYDQAFGTLLYGNADAWDAMSYNPDAWHYVHNFNQWGQLLGGVPELLREQLIRVATHNPHARVATGVYTRQGFNAHGDMVAHLNAPQPPALQVPITIAVPEFNRSFLKVLRDFDQLARQRGARFYFMPPCIAQSYWDKSQVPINYLVDQIRRQGSPEVIGNPADRVLPDSDFFDTVYHQNATGREASITKLLPVLRAAILQKP